MCFWIQLNKHIWRPWGRGGTCLTIQGQSGEHQCSPTNAFLPSALPQDKGNCLRGNWKTSLLLNKHALPLLLALINERFNFSTSIFRIEVVLKGVSLRLLLKSSILNQIGFNKTDWKISSLFFLLDWLDGINCCGVVQPDCHYNAFKDHACCYWLGLDENTWIHFSIIYSVILVQSTITVGSDGWGIKALPNIPETFPDSLISHHLTEFCKGKRCHCWAVRLK